MNKIIYKQSKFILNSNSFIYKIFELYFKGQFISLHLSEITPISISLLEFYIK